MVLGPVDLIFDYGGDCEEVFSAHIRFFVCSIVV